MDKKRSLEILDRCLSQISSMSQEEFDKIEKKKGLDKLDLASSSIYTEFEIIFSSVKFVTESFLSHYDYSLLLMDNLNLYNWKPELLEENQTLYLAA